MIVVIDEVITNNKNIKKIKCSKKWSNEGEVLLLDALDNNKL